MTDSDIAADNPLATNVYVVLDGSGSMSEQRCAPGGSKMREAIQALRAFAATIPDDTQLGLMVFTDNQVREDVPLGAGNRERFVQASMNIQPGGGTPLKTAIDLAYRRLTDQGRSQLGYGEYHLVVVTDGEASKGQDPTPVVNRLLADSPVVLHTIGFCIGTDHSLNQPGRTLYRTADNAAALTAGLQSVLAEAPSFTVTSFQ
jgi:Mg-chelatase subunit ChlD